MILYVYDSDIIRIGLVENISSLQWLEEYQDAGEVKLVCSATEKNFSLLKNGNRLYCTDQIESALICEVTIDDSGENAQLTVRAQLSVSRWADRVVMATENIVGAEDGMLSLANKHRRGLSGATASSKGLPQTLNTQVTWGSVLDAWKKLSAASALGFRETFEAETGIETFEVYSGIDRSSGEFYNGYFGNDADNLSSVKIARSIAKWKNVAIVGGSGEGTARKIVTVSLADGSEEDRRELWVDAKDISVTYQIATPDGSGGFTYNEATYTDAEYTTMLEARGMERLTEQLPKLDISAELGQGLMQYGVDYALGDIVPLKHTRYGLKLTARVVKVRTIYESSGCRVTATLDDYNMTKEDL